MEYQPPMRVVIEPKITNRYEVSNYSHENSKSYKGYSRTKQGARPASEKQGGSFQSTRWVP